MKMSGMKKSPLRAAATMLALTGLRMVCISMLVSTMLATSGKLSMLVVLKTLPKVF